jgi:HSP20 family molecular chaperone IbpA
MSNGTNTTSPDRQREIIVRPPVDIYEDEKGITLLADLPGVRNEGLHLHVDRDTLSIDAELHRDLPGGGKILFSELRGQRYQRSFSLSAELDAEATEANLKDGVLSIRIPKRAEHTPKKIQVQLA